MAYGGDEGTLEWEGDYYCLHEEDLWLWDPGCELWESLDTWPEAFIVVNGYLAVKQLDGRHYCVCPLRDVLMNCGCQCGGI
jgi:hypothetical protein